jgi:hypothetical protein
MQVSAAAGARGGAAVPGPLAFVAKPGVAQRWSQRRSVSQFRQMTTPAAHRRRRPSAGRVSSQARASHPAQAAGAPSKTTVAFALSPLVSLARSRQSRCQWGFSAQTVALSLGRSPTEKELPRASASERERPTRGPSRLVDTRNAAGARSCAAAPPTASVRRNSRYPNDTIRNDLRPSPERPRDRRRAQRRPEAAAQRSR